MEDLTFKHALKGLAVYAGVSPTANLAAVSVKYGERDNMFTVTTSDGNVDIVIVDDDSIMLYHNTHYRWLDVYCELKELIHHTMTTISGGVSENSIQLAVNKYTISYMVYSITSVIEAHYPKIDINALSSRGVDMSLHATTCGAIFKWGDEKILVSLSAAEPYTLSLTDMGTGEWYVCDMSSTVNRDAYVALRLTETYRRKYGEYIDLNKYL